MATALRPIKHEDRLSLVEHLDELRTRLILCGVTLVVAFGICFWQNGTLLSWLNRPLQETSIRAQSGGRLSQASRQATLQRKALEQLGGAVNTLAEGAENLRPRTRVAFAAQLRAYNATVAKLPSTPPKRAPVTLGVGEPFTTTLSTSFWFALIFSLPVILYQLYAFVLPAFSRRERQVAMALMPGVDPVTTLLEMIPLLALYLLSILLLTWLDRRSPVFRDEEDHDDEEQYEPLDFD